MKVIPNENTWLGFIVGALQSLAAPTGPAVTTLTTGGTLPAATAYFYKVTATNAAGESAGSAEVTVTTGAGATNSDTVTWSAVTGATGYKVYRGTTAGGENVVVGTTASGTLTFTDTGGATTAGVPPVAGGVANSAAPSFSKEISRAVDLTGYLISLTANTTGNTIPTPTLKTLFETSITGTTTAQFSADFYRDDQNDLAWATLPRRTTGAFVLSRFGGKSTTTPGAPIQGDSVEVWPVRVNSRAASAMTSNTVEMFTVSGSVPYEPNDSAVVAA